MRRAWARAALGGFLELRLIPVLLWSFTAIALGTGLAGWELGRIDVGWFAVAMALGVLIQGWTTHAINEIYDWRSGTDRHASPRALSGGSKVLTAGLMTERGLWILFAAASAAVGVLGAVVGLARAPWLVAIVVLGYGIGVAYTLPPVATSYRPFLGEWLGGFPGVLLSGVGAYAIQTLRISPAAVAALAAHACVCTGMLIMHHYLDLDADLSASPRKRTSVVVLGPRAAVGYATGTVAAGALLYGALGLLVHPAFLLGSAATALAAVFHARTRPGDLHSVTRNELRIIQLGIVAGVGTAVALVPGLWPLAPLAVLGYLAHVAAAAPPSDLARAWRRPAVDPDGRGTSK